MTAILYRDLNFDDSHEVAWAAQVYCDSPLFWDSNWQVSSIGISSVASRIRESRHPTNSLLLVAESSGHQLVGFHWLVLEDVGPRTAKYSGYRAETDDGLCARRVSTWVHESMWGRGIATELMTRGEHWARSMGARKVTVTVHSRNSRMMSLNLKRGYEAGMVEMSKSLA